MISVEEIGGALRCRMKMSKYLLNDVIFIFFEIVKISD